jgi:hypothetical protein
VLSGTFQWAFEATANGMDFSIDGHKHHVIARRWQRRGIAPCARLQAKPVGLNFFRSIVTF